VNKQQLGRTSTCPTVPYKVASEAVLQPNRTNMGCIESVDKIMSRECFALFRRMQLSRREIRTLFRLHKKFQTNTRGSLDIVEWLTLIDLERNSLTERIFMISDRDGDGLLNLYEFVVSVWKFCILGDHSLSNNLAAIYVQPYNP
jgi:hypothetical protein